MRRDTEREIRRDTQSRPFSRGGRSSKGRLCARSRANHSDGRTNDAYSLSQVTAERVYCCIHGRHGAEATYEVD